MPEFFEFLELFRFRTLRSRSVEIWLFFCESSQSSFSPCSSQFQSFFDCFFEETVVPDMCARPTPLLGAGGCGHTARHTIASSLISTRSPTPARQPRLVYTLDTCSHAAQQPHTTRRCHLAVSLNLNERRYTRQRIPPSRDRMPPATKRAVARPAKM